MTNNSGYSIGYSVSKGNILSYEEQDAMMEALNVVLNMLPQTPKKGTLLLNGQKHSEDAELVMRLNFFDGESEWKQRFGPCSVQFSSNEIAEEAINKVVPEKYYGQSQIVFPEPHLKTLVFYAAYGRFLCSCYADFLGDGHVQSTIVLLAVAKILAKLCEADDGIKESWEFLMSNPIYRSMFSEYEKAIDVFFESESIALKRWKDWLKRSNPGLLNW